MEIVPFELAKKLKEKGFDKYCCRAYSEIGCFNDTDTYKYSEEFYCYAPTISQVLKWLRDEKKIFVQISLFEYCYDYCILDTTMVYYDNEHKVLHQGPTGYSYEEAALAGISWTLDNLI